MPVKLNSTGGGSVTLTTPSTASDFTLTAPAQTATLITNSSGVLDIGSGQIYKDASGNVGIGTSSPTDKLQVNTQDGVRLGASGAVSYARIGSANTGESTAQISYDRSSGATIISQGNTGSTLTERMRIDSSGNLLVGTTTVNAKLTVEGEGPAISTSYAYLALSGTTAITGYVASTSIPYSIWTSGRVSSAEFDARSDERLKKDITPIPVSDAWRFIQNVIPVHYKWINGPDDGHKFGFIAQNVIKAGFPNLVGQYADNNVPEVTDADGFTSPAGVTLTLNYDQIVPVLASALRDALAQIDDLKARLTALEAN